MSGELLGLWTSCLLYIFHLYLKIRFHLLINIISPQGQKHLNSLGLTSLWSELIDNWYSLKIETDRKFNIESCNRFCIKCDQLNIEDEFHFILVCPLT